MDELVCQELVERVTDYLEGVLGPAEAERVTRHLAGCDGCTAYVAQMETTIRLTAALPREVPGAADAERLLETYRRWSAGRDGG